MAIRISRSVTRVEIDNRLQGHVMGKLWLLDREDPILLNLHGDCLRDMAGLRMVFSNPQPEPEEPPVKLHSEQNGDAGEMTASLKVTVWGVSFEEAETLRKAAQPVPEFLTNCLYLEWFSQSNGRVVIELTPFLVEEFSDAEWRMSPDMEEQQHEQNNNAFRSFLEQTEDDEDEDDTEYEPLDEFGWEESFRESDSLTARYSKIMEKYIGHPDADKLIAREMGWDWMDDALDADERGLFDRDRSKRENDDAFEPNPFTEGLDWIETDDGSIRHPLSHRAFEHAMTMWRRCEKNGLLGEHGDKDVHEMLFQSQMLSAKLAGALDSLAYEFEPEGGFVVAALKRALQYFDKAIAASWIVEKRQLIPVKQLANFRTGLFRIREEMLTLMKRYRREI